MHICNNLFGTNRHRGRNVSPLDQYRFVSSTLSTDVYEFLQYQGECWKYTKGLHNILGWWNDKFVGFRSGISPRFIVLYLRIQCLIKLNFLANEICQAFDAIGSGNYRTFPERVLSLFAKKRFVFNQQKRETRSVRRRNGPARRRKDKSIIEF